MDIGVIVKALKCRSKSLEAFWYRGLATTDAGADTVDQIAAIRTDRQTTAGEVSSAGTGDYRHIITAHHREPVGVGETVRRACEVDRYAVLAANAASLIVAPGCDPVLDSHILF